MLKRIIGKIKQWKRKLYYSCYKNIEGAKNGKCPGLTGGTKATEYLSEMCIGCPYLCLDWSEENETD